MILSRTGQVRRWRALRAAEGRNVRGQPYKVGPDDRRRNRSVS